MRKPTIMPRIAVLLLAVILLSLTACAQANHESKNPRDTSIAPVGGGADIHSDDHPANPQNPSTYNVEEADDGAPANLPKTPQPQRPAPKPAIQGPVINDPYAIDAEPYRITFERRYGSLLNYGIEITARDGAIYYESPDQGGSGRHGTANNIYTAKMYVAGFAIVERSSGRPIMSHCFDRAHVPSYRPAPARFWEYDSLNADLLVAACADGFTTGEIGWFRAEDLVEHLPNNNANDSNPRDGSGPKEPLPAPLPTNPDPKGVGDGHTGELSNPDRTESGTSPDTENFTSDLLGQYAAGYGLPEPLPESHADLPDTNQPYGTNRIVYYR